MKETQMPFVPAANLHSCNTAYWIESILSQLNNAMRIALDVLCTY